jgi:hypothetical protein
MEAAGKIRDALRSELEYYFGSVQNAKVAVQTDKRILNGWSKKKLVLMIQQRHRLKHTLAYGVMRRDFPAWVSAAEAYFGTWGDAL